MRCPECQADFWVIPNSAATCTLLQPFSVGDDQEQVSSQIWAASLESRRGCWWGGKLPKIRALKRCAKR